MVNTTKKINNTPQIPIQQYIYYRILVFKGAFMTTTITSSTTYFIPTLALDGSRIKQIKNAPSKDDIIKLWDRIVDFFCNTKRVQALEHFFTLFDQSATPQARYDAFMAIENMADPTAKQYFVKSLTNVSPQTKDVFLSIRDRQDNELIHLTLQVDRTYHTHELSPEQCAACATALTSHSESAARQQLQTDANRGTYYLNGELLSTPLVSTELPQHLSSAVLPCITQTVLNQANNRLVRDCGIPPEVPGIANKDTASTFSITTHGDGVYQVVATSIKDMAAIPMTEERKEYLQMVQENTWSPSSNSQTEGSVAFTDYRCIKVTMTCDQQNGVVVDGVTLTCGTKRSCQSIEINAG